MIRKKCFKRVQYSCVSLTVTLETIFARQYQLQLDLYYVSDKCSISTTTMMTSETDSANSESVHVKIFFEVHTLLFEVYKLHGNNIQSQTGNFSLELTPV